MTSTAIALPASREPAAPTAAAAAMSPISPRRLVAFLAMCFGMFMAFLDIQIVSSSLTDIQAGLSASADEIPWVQTAYLIAEVIAIPLSGFLSRALGTRILFAISAAGFTLASIMCGTSSSIDSMIVWRALAGLHRRRHGADRVRVGLSDLPGSAAEADRAGGRTDRDARAHHRPDGRRLSDRRLFLALAVLHQCRARHHRHRDHGAVDRFRQAGPDTAQELRLVRSASAWPAFSARSNMCWKRGRATNGSTTTRSSQSPSCPASQPSYSLPAC